MGVAFHTQCRHTTKGGLSRGVHVLPGGVLLLFELSACPAPASVPGSRTPAVSLHLRGLRPAPRTGIQLPVLTVSIPCLMNHILPDGLVRTRGANSCRLSFYCAQPRAGPAPASQVDTPQGRPGGRAWGRDEPGGKHAADSWSFPEVRTHLHLNIFCASLGKIAFAGEDLSCPGSVLLRPNLHLRVEKALFK